MKVPEPFQLEPKCFSNLYLSQKSNLTLEQNDETDCQLIKWIYFSD